MEAAAARAVVASLALPLLMTAERCGPAQLESRILTAVRADGVIERAVCQPAVAAAPEARLADRWSELGRWDICAADPKKWDGDFAPRPGSPPDDDPSATLAAFGRYASTGDIPDHHRVMVGDSSRLSHLVPVYERRDYGFVVEHTWRETLTETTSPGQARDAAARMATVETVVVSAAIRQAFGASHDVDALLAWLPGYMAAYLWALTESLIELPDQRPPQAGGCRSDGDLDQLMAAKMAQAGYAGTGGDVRPAVRKQVLALSVQPDGAPAGEDVVEAISGVVDWVLDPTEILVGNWPQKFSTDTDALLWSALQTAMTETAGGVEQFVEQERLMADGAWGAWTRLLVGNAVDRFLVGLRLPGAVTAANGVRNGESGVTWDFESTCAYPSGYTMWARSLEPRVEVQVRLLNTQPLVTREQMTALADLVRPDPMLAQALARSAQAGSLQPLREFRTAAGTGDRTDRQRRLTRVWHMLGLQ